MYIKTEHLTIVPFSADMAKQIHLQSLCEDTRRFLPDEVFETEEDALDTISFLMSVYESGDGPLVYPFLLDDGTVAGYVQAVPLDDGQWEIGYHTGKEHTCKGYATEAVTAFLPVIMKLLNLSEMHGICHADNAASRRVLSKCGFVQVFEGVAPYHGQDNRVAKYIYRTQTRDHNAEH